MGYVVVIVPCVLCKQSFTCNPAKVPSLKVDGVREGMCEPCFYRGQATRKKEGVELWPDPLSGAWDTAADENEVSWQ